MRSSPDGGRIIGYPSPGEPGGGAAVRMVAGSLDAVTYHQGSQEGQNEEQQSGWWQDHWILLPVTRGARRGRRRSSSPDGDMIIVSF